MHLQGTVLQRMQRFATQSRLLQLVLHLIAQEERPWDKGSESALKKFASADEILVTWDETAESWVEPGGSPPTSASAPAKARPAGPSLARGVAIAVGAADAAAFAPASKGAHAAAEGCAVAMDAHQLQRFLGHLGYNVSVPECSHLMQRLDVNEDNVLTETELHVCLLDWDKVRVVPWGARIDKRRARRSDAWIWTWTAADAS